MKEPIANRIMYGLKMLVAVLIGLSACTILIPLLIPLGFGGWIHEQVTEPHLRFLGSWYVWPQPVRILYGVFWYVYFIVDVVLLFAAKRLWVLLIYLAILIASTYASLYTLKDALAFPVPILILPASSVRCFRAEYVIIPRQYEKGQCDR